MINELFLEYRQVSIKMFSLFEGKVVEESINYIQL